MQWDGTAHEVWEQTFGMISKIWIRQSWKCNIDKNHRFFSPLSLWIKRTATWELPQHMKINWETYDKVLIRGSKKMTLKCMRKLTYFENELGPGVLQSSVQEIRTFQAFQATRTKSKRTVNSRFWETEFCHLSWKFLNDLVIYFS